MRPSKLDIVEQSEIPNPVFSIIIPSWNNLRYLNLCIQGIINNSDFKHQIIVVVNEGIDGTLDMIKKSNLDYIYSSENIGVCYALNSARSLVKANYIVYLNDDMYVLPHWDSELHKEIDSIGHKNFLISSTMIEPLDTGNTCVIVANYGDSPENFRMDELLSEFQNLNKEDWSGSTWPPVVIHRDLWDIVGGLSIEFSPGMYSDPDLSMKLWHFGVRIFKGVDNSRCYHFGSKSTHRIKRNDGRRTFLLKWGITSRVFTKYYLRSGEKYIGPLKEPVFSKFQILLFSIRRLF